MLSRPNPPTAIIAINDMYAFGVYAGARDLGLKVPDDVSVTGVEAKSGVLPAGFAHPAR